MTATTLAPMPVGDMQCVPVLIEHRGAELTALLDLPKHAQAVVVVVQGFGGVTTSPYTDRLVEHLTRNGLGALRVELTQEADVLDPCHAFDVGVLADRLEAAVHWLASRPATVRLPCVLFGMGTAAAAALLVAAHDGASIAAVVCGGGRPDLTDAELAAVLVPVMLLAGSHDTRELGLLRRSCARLGAAGELVVIAHAVQSGDEDHVFELTARLIARRLLGRTRRQCTGTTATGTGLFASTPSTT